METHIIRVEYADGDHQVTRINGTKREIADYYRGKVFNVGRGPHDYMVRCKSVHFLTRVSR